MNLPFQLRTGTFCIAGAAVILPSLAIYAPLGITPLLVLVAIGVAVLEGKHFLAGLVGLCPLIGLLGVLALWGLVSALWSIVPQHSVTEAMRFWGISLAGLTVLGAVRAAPATDRSRISRSLIVGVTLAAIILISERLAGTPIMRLWHPLPLSSLNDHILVYFRFDRGVTVLVLMLWAALFAPVKLWLRLVLLIAVAAIVILMISETSLLALGAGLFVLVTARFFPRAVATLMIVGLVTLSIAIPLATPSYQRVDALHNALPSIKWSGIHRLLIWRFASDRVAERPVLGWGMDASRAIPGGDTDLVTLLPPGPYPAQAPALPLHPHNGALELLLELGIPGLLLGLATIGWIIVCIAWRAKLSPAARTGALALTMSSLTVGLLSFGVWQEWWQSTIWLTAALFAATATRAGAAPASPAG